MYHCRGPLNHYHLLHKYLPFYASFSSNPNSSLATATTSSVAAVTNTGAQSAALDPNDPNLPDADPGPYLKTLGQNK